MRPPYEYLCARCAYRLGGMIPADHVYTMHLGDCERCNEVEGLAHVRNWTWPTQIENDRTQIENARSTS